MVEKGGNPVDEVNELVDTLISLAPTYNRITQFVLLAKGRDYETIKEMYPDLMKDRKVRNRIFRALGMYIGSDGKIETEFYSLAECLRDIVNLLFGLFERSDIRDKITAALFNENISNLKEDWVASRLETLKEMSKESKAAAVSVLILKVLKKLREEGGYDYEWIEKDQIVENLEKEFDESVILDAIDILLKYKLLKQSDQKYGLSDILWKYRLLIDDIEVE